VVARGAYGGTALFRGLAALPFFIPLPGDGRQEFQPIHVADLARVVTLAIEEASLVRKTVDPVGPDVVTLGRLLEDYRRWLGLAPVPVLAMPAALVRMATWLGDRLGGPINSTAAAQLAFGNTGDPTEFERAVGFRPRRWRDVLAAEPAHVQDRWHARLYFVRPLLRATLALLWLVSGVVGMFAGWGPELAAASGMPVSTASAMLLLLCVADIAIGALIAARWRPRLVCGIQVVMITAYTVVASALWPAMWAHPLGLLLKNLPIIAAALALGAIEEER